MTLLEVVSWLDEPNETSDLLTIYATEPWRPESEVVVIDQPEDGSTSVTFKTASDADASYFLEVFVARDFLRGWRAGGYRPPLPENRSSPLEADCERLIRYAIDDA